MSLTEWTPEPGSAIATIRRLWPGSWRTRPTPNPINYVSRGRKQWPDTSSNKTPTISSPPVMPITILTHLIYHYRPLIVPFAPGNDRPDCSRNRSAAGPSLTAPPATLPSIAFCSSISALTEPSGRKKVRCRPINSPSILTTFATIAGKKMPLGWRQLGSPAKRRRNGDGDGPAG